MAESDYYIQDDVDIEGQKLEAAKGLYKLGDYKGALRLYLDMLNSEYTYTLCYEIGRCYYKLDDIANAELYFVRSTTLEDYKNPSYTYLGNIFYKRNNLSKAIENWIIAHSYKPEDENICINLATTYFSKNMRLYAIYFYKKYLKYAKDKNSASYHEIKKIIEDYTNIGQDFFKKALNAVSANDNETAIKALEYAVNNMPFNFDINNLLGKLYFEQKKYSESIKYLLKAYCLDSKSSDILKKLSSVMVLSGDTFGSYCCMKRLLQLSIGNQKEYLNIIKTTNNLRSQLNNESIQKHLEIAKKYYEDNHYHMALFEFENCILADNNLSYEYDNIIQRIKMFLYPETRIIKNCFEKGMFYYSGQDYAKANKYFTKIMTLSDKTSSDYKMAKSRIVHA